MKNMTSAGYALHPTPIGDALIVVTDDGLVALTFLDDATDDALTEISLALRMPVAPDDAATAEVRRQLDEYFDGDRRAFDLALDWRLVEGFRRDALEAVCTVPFGETASYAEVAILAGSPRAHRAVGSACAHTPISLVVPAHRVIRADGSIGEYGGHPERKRFLLDHEARVARFRAEEVDPAGV